MSLTAKQIPVLRSIVCMHSIISLSLTFFTLHSLIDESDDAVTTVKVSLIHNPSIEVTPLVCPLNVNLVEFARF